MRFPVQVLHKELYGILRWRLGTSSWLLLLGYVVNITTSLQFTLLSADEDLGSKSCENNQTKICGIS